MKNHRVEQIMGHFGEIQGLSQGKDIKSARKLERKIARLTAQVARTVPNTQFHADALAYHGYALLALGRMSRRSNVVKQLRAAAYDKEIAAVTIRLNGKRDRGVAFAAYNLGIDLCVAENGPSEAVVYLRAARGILARIPKNQVHAGILFWIDYGIAKCHYDLGNRSKAQRLLVRVVAASTPKKYVRDFGALRGLAKCAELLAQIDLDNRTAKRK